MHAITRTSAAAMLFAATLVYGQPADLAAAKVSPSQAAAAATADPTTTADPQWVAAGIAQAVAPAPEAAAGFPSAQTVIAPPASSFQTAPNGPANYGVATGQGGYGQPGANGAQSVQAPPVINQARDVVSPFTAPEIRELHGDFDETRRAKASQPVNTVPRISSISVDLSPGGAPPMVRTARNEPSTVLFLDSTGAPWPLAAAPRLATGDYFDVVWLKDTASIVITALSSYEQTGIAVFLKGLPTPIMIKLTSGDPDSSAKTRIVDYRLDLRIPGRGPGAKAPILGPGRIGLYDDVLQAFLDGVPPTDARHIRIEGEPPSHTQVWQLGGSMYLRTPLDIRSAFEQTMSSADGMHVYKLDPTPLIAVSQGGQNLSLTLDIE
jgi:intracellular multiplication protein IcmK